MQTTRGSIEVSRLPSIGLDRMSSEQRELFERITGGARGRARARADFLDEQGGLRGPFNPWLYCPALGEPAQRLGESLRFGGQLPGRVRELAILVVAAAWRAQYEWWAHARIGRAEGLCEDLLEALRTGRTPELLDPADAAVYDFVRELVETRRVSPPVYERAVSALGEAGTVELVMLAGYYTLVSMTLNAFEIPLPRGESAPFPA